MENRINPTDDPPVSPAIERAHRNAIFPAHAFNPAFGASFFQDLFFFLISESRAHPSTVRSNPISLQFLAAAS